MAVNANPEGARFIIKAGVHLRQKVDAKRGNSFVGEPGAVLSGENSTEYAFWSYQAPDVVIEGLVIEKYASPEGWGVIRGTSDNWTIRNNEIRHNGGIGVSSGGNGWKIIGNYVHHNGQLGLWGTGNNMLIDGNEIAYNNSNRRYDPNIMAGGGKWYRTLNMVVRNNYSHDNHGPGLWTDGHNVNTVYEGNRVTNNYHAGIQHEIACSAVIRNNTVEGNGFGVDGWVGGAGILVLNSPDVEIYGNVVRNNNDGIGGVHASRTQTAPDNCTKELRNMNVHHNTVVMSVGQTGIVTNISGTGLFSSWGNKFDHNTYILGAGTKYYRWGFGGEIDRNAWQNAGQDINGTWK